MRVLVTGHLRLHRHRDDADAGEAGHDVIGLDSDLYERCTFAAGGEIARRAVDPQGRARRRRSTISRASMRSFTWRPCPTIRSAISDPASPTTSIIAPACASPSSPSRRACARFLFASSCSNYGQAGEDMIDETGALNPVTAYGRVEGLVGARHRAACRRRLLPGLPASGDRLWRVAAAALRHRAQQSGRLGRDQAASSS